MVERSEYRTIKYYKASKLASIDKSPVAEEVLKLAAAQDNIAVLIAITNPLKIEKAVNITKGGFSQVKELVS